MRLTVSWYWSSASQIRLYSASILSRERESISFPAPVQRDMVNCGVGKVINRLDFSFKESSETSFSLLRWFDYSYVKSSS